MKQDYWFEPGDKVVKVIDESALGLTVGDGAKLGNPSHMKLGAVHCVTECWHSPVWGNLVSIAGLNHGGGGFYARVFRKVEEIRMCVKAAQKVGEPVETELSGT